MATATEKIQLNNIGPIEHLDLTTPPGAITVLRGPNGSGKSTVLNAVDRVVTGKKSKHGQLSSRDGTTGGTVEAYGVRLRISRGGQNRTSGECIVESVEGDLNIADFVDPPLKDPNAADARRIKALVVLTGAEAEESLFYDLFAGGRDDFLEIVPEDDRKETDLLELAGKIKRAVERKARDYEGQAENLAREIGAMHDSLAGIDFDEPHDADELDAAADLARDVVTKKRAEFQWFQENAKAYESAKESLAEPPVDQQAIEDELTQLNHSILADDVAIGRLRKQLDELKATKAAKEQKAEHLRQRSHDAGKMLVQRRELEKLVEQFEARSRPTLEEIEAAEAALNAARQARDRGVTIRAAVSKREAIDAKEQTRRELANLGDSLRTAARGTENVLADVVKRSCPRLRVDEEFRLQIEYPKRGACYFSELSEGERWRVGIEIAIAAFKAKGQPGLLQIPQAAWEGLDGDNRAVILEAIRGTDLAVITAEATHEAGADAELAVETIE